MVAISYINEIKCIRDSSQKLKITDYLFYEILSVKLKAVKLID